MAGTSCLHVALDGRNRRKGRFVDIDHNRELTWWLQLATPWALPKIYITFHLPGFKSSILRNDGAENCWTLQPLWMQAQWIRLRIRKSERKASIGNIGGTVWGTLWGTGNFAQSFHISRTLSDSARPSLTRSPGKTPASHKRLPRCDKGSATFLRATLHALTGSWRVLQSPAALRLENGRFATYASSKLLVDTIHCVQRMQCT